jgi:Dolichyl-phosphate-mannose-protein mannosyltransferase
MTALMERVEAPLRAARADRGVVLALVLGLLALQVRAIGLGRANDLFIDEITYANLANTVASGQLPNQDGVPFFLHPIGSFLLNGLVIRLFGLHGDAMDLVFDLRWMNAVLGAVTVVLAVLIVRRLAGFIPAAVAGVVLAFDPFVLRMDGRLMIETPATLAVLAGWTLLLTALDREPGPARTRYELGAGAVFGVALLMKDMTAVSTVLPLVLAGLWRRTVSWWTVRRTLALVPVPYLVYLAVVAFSGLLPDWWTEKVGGVLRMVGVNQETGFNAAPGADLVGRLIEMLTRFGTSYVLLGLGLFAGLAAAFSAVPTRRLVGLVAVTTGALGIYSVVGGAAEEQFGYYVVVTSVLAMSAVWPDLADRRPAWRRPVAAAVLVFSVVTAGLGVSARTATDDGFQQARAYLDTLPAGSRVGLTDVTGEFALLPHDDWGVWPSLSSLQTNDAQYVLTRSHQLSNGYGYAAPELLDWLAAHATPVFTATGPTNGDTVVWRLTPGALDAAAAAGVTLRPVEGGYP